MPAIRANFNLRFIGEAILVAAAVAAFYAVHLDPSRAATGGDYLNLFWPIKELRLQTLADSGAILLWNPYTFMGSPAAASMQHAVFYPIDYLFFWPRPLWGAMNWYLLFHNVLAGVGAWWWMRRGWNAGTLASIMCGITFPCTAWFWGAQEHINQIAAVSWMPWILSILLIRYHAQISARKFISGYAGLSALQLLAGHPQAAFYTHLIAGLTVAAFIAAPRNGTRKQITVRILLPWLSACMLAGLLAAMQLLPAMELSAQSYRQFDAATPAYALGFSMPPDVLRALAVPNAFGSYTRGFSDARNYGEYAVYVGGITVLLAALGAALLFASKRRRTAFYFSALLILTLLLAMGGNISISRLANFNFTEFPAPASGLHELSPQELLVRVLPPAKGFRVPARILAVTALMWASLAGFGAAYVVGKFAAISKARGNSAAIMALSCVLVAAAWIALYLPSREWKFRHPSPLDDLQLAIEEDRARYSEPTLDNRVYRLTTADADLLAAERDAPSRAQWEEQLLATTETARWLRFSENMNAVVNVPSVEGYEEGLLPSVRTKDFLFKYNRHFRSFQPDEQLFALLGVSRIFADLPLDETRFPRSPSESIHLRTMHHVPASRGAAFWLAQTEGIDLSVFDGPYQLGTFPLGMRQTELHEFGSAPNWIQSLPRLATDVRNPNTVRISTDGEIPGDAIVAMAYAPGWRVNETDARWLNAVHVRVPREAFRDGVAMLRYEPQSYRVGLFLSGIGLVLLGALGTLARRGRTYDA